MPRRPLQLLAVIVVVLCAACTTSQTAHDADALRPLLSAEEAARSVYAEEQARGRARVIDVQLRLDPRTADGPSERPVYLIRVALTRLIGCGPAGCRGETALAEVLVDARSGQTIFTAETIPMPSVSPMSDWAGQPTASTSVP